MILVLPALILSTSLSLSAPSLPIVVKGCEIDEMYAFNTAECEITVSNRTDHEVQIISARPVDSKDGISPSSIAVPPKSTIYLAARINSDGNLGGHYHNFELKTDIKGSDSYRASVYAFVMSGLDQALPEIDFGVIDENSKAVSKAIKLTSGDIADFRIANIIDAPDWLRANIGTTGDTLVVSVMPNASWGLHVGNVKVAINLPEQKEATVKVKALIHGEVLPTSNPFDLGLIHLSGKHSFQIELKSRSGRNFQIGSISGKNLDVSTRVTPCSLVRVGCQTLNIDIPNHQTLGAIDGRLIISFPEFDQSLSLAVWGLVVPKDFQIKAIDKGDKTKGSNSDVQTHSSRPAPFDLQNAVKHAVVAAQTPTPAGSGPLLKWTISNGKLLHGFQIFRGEFAVGPFILLNKHTISSISKLNDPVSYQYRDNTAKSGTTYWYYIGLVFNDGHKQQLTGPQKVIAK